MSEEAKQESTPVAAAIEKVEKKTKSISSRWTESGRKLMKESPDYFVYWYTGKSIALVGAVALAAYYLGKSRGQTQGMQVAASIWRGRAGTEGAPAHVSGAPITRYAHPSDRGTYAFAR